MADYRSMRSRGKRMASGVRPPVASKIAPTKMPPVIPKGNSNVSGKTESETSLPHVNDMLSELMDLMKQVDQARTTSAESYVSINKVHDKVRSERKLNQSHTNKLHKLYTDALHNAKSENALISQTLVKVKAIKDEVAAKKSQEQSQLKQKGGAIRKGVLMNILQQTARISVWHGGSGESPPPLCGCKTVDEKYKAKPHDHVAARVKMDDGEEQWIMAVVVKYDSHHHKYTVDDFDEDGKESGYLSSASHYQVNRRRVIPLPQYKADPQKHIEALFKKGQTVLALYPQTTCFYKAIIHEQPTDVDHDYAVLFEDTSYPEGYSPPLYVPQRFVIPIKEGKRQRT